MRCGDLHEIKYPIQVRENSLMCLLAKTLVAGQICPQYNRLTSVFVLL